MLTSISTSTPKVAQAPAVHIVHENDIWVQPLRAQLERLEVPFHEWFIDDVVLDLSSVPPDGVFYNRMSASSHTRDHRHAWEATRGVMTWLEAHGRRVINNRLATAYEVSKVEQILTLRDHGLSVPRSMAATGRKALLSAAQHWDAPFIVKPNRGGKGTGVTLVRSPSELQAIADDFDSYTLDGTVLLQEYIQPADGRVLRLEFIGQAHYYTVSIDAGGGFDLCPSDSCQVGAAHCPADGRSRFEILTHHAPDVLDRCKSFLKATGMEVAAMEAAPAEDGRLVFYDVNINTNYNAEAEGRQGNARQGMRAIAEFLQLELAKTTPLSWPQNRAS